MLACQVLRDHHHFHDSIVDLGYEIGFGTFLCYPLLLTTSRSNAVPSTQDENGRKMMRVAMSCTSSAECTIGEQWRYLREILRKSQLFSDEARYLQLDEQLYLDLLSSLRKIFSKLQTAYCGGEIPDLMISFVTLWNPVQPNCTVSFVGFTG